MEGGLQPRTAKNVHRAALSSVFNWAVAKRLLDASPVNGVAIKARKPVKARSKGFRDDEARKVLTAALAVEPSSKHPTLSAAKRWVPFLCA
jgi:hypothetical protein